MNEQNPYSEAPRKPNFFQSVQQSIAKLNPDFDNHSNAKRFLAVGIVIFPLLAIVLTVYVLKFPTTFFSQAAEVSSLRNGLVAYWRLDEESGDNAADVAGTNNASAVSTTIVEGKSNKARKIGGSNSAINVNDNSAFSSDQISVGGWIKPQGFGSGNYASIFNRRPASNNAGMTLELAGGEDGGQLQCSFNIINPQGSDTGMGLVTNGNTKLNDGVWNHVACTYDGNMGKLYINGQIVSSGTVPGKIKQSDAMQIQLGRNVVSAQSFANAVLDEFAVWNRALTDQEVIHLSGGILPIPLPSPPPPPPPSGSVDKSAYINVKDYGARGDGVTDDTAAIQKAINDNNQGKSMYRQIYFPNGEYVVSAINATRKHGLFLRGESLNGVRLIPKQSTPMPVIDGTGSSAFQMENIAIWSLDSVTGVAPQVIPTVGILIAPTYLGQDSTKVHFTGVSVLGFFEKAAYYLYSPTDSSFINTTGQIWKNGAHALIITSNNSINGQDNYVTSSYIDIAPANLPSHANDFTCVQCEFHNLAKQNNGQPLPNNGQSTNGAIILQNASLIRFIGGIISSHGPYGVSLRGKNEEIVFDAVHLSHEINTYPTNTFYNEGTIEGFALRNIIVHGGVSANGGIIAGSNTASFKGLTLTGSISNPAAIPQGAKLIKIDNHANPATVTLSGSQIMADGMAIAPGGSIKNSIIIDPGAIEMPTGATDTSLKTN